MIICGIDIETGAPFGTPHEENFITEVGVVLWDTELKTPVRMMNTLVVNNQKISIDAEQYTGISNSMVEEYGRTWDFCKTAVQNMVDEGEHVVAHNGKAFDMPILNANNIEFKDNIIDTMTDIPYPANCMSRNLTYLQGFHGFNYPGHRAIFDVMAMLRILSGYDIQQVINISKSPTMLVQAKVDYNSRQKAKDAKFYWDGDNKRWLKEVKEYWFTEEAAKWNFEYNILKEEI